MVLKIIKEATGLTRKESKLTVVGREPYVGLHLKLTVAVY